MKYTQKKILIFCLLSTNHYARTVKPDEQRFKNGLTIGKNLTTTIDVSIRQSGQPYHISNLNLTPDGAAFFFNIALTCLPRYSQEQLTKSSFLQTIESGVYNIKNVYNTIRYLYSPNKPNLTHPDLSHSFSGLLLAIPAQAIANIVTNNPVYEELEELPYIGYHLKQGKLAVKDIVYVLAVKKLAKRSGTKLPEHFGHGIIGVSVADYAAKELPNVTTVKKSADKLNVDEQNLAALLVATGGALTYQFGDQISQEGSLQASSQLFAHSLLDNTYVQDFARKNGLGALVKDGEYYGVSKWLCSMILYSQLQSFKKKK